MEPHMKWKFEVVWLLEIHGHLYMCLLFIAGRIIMVVLESLAGTGHKLVKLRPKIGDKLEQIAFDPYGKSIDCLSVFFFFVFVF